MNKKGVDMASIYSFIMVVLLPFLFFVCLHTVVDFTFYFSKTCDCFHDNGFWKFIWIQFKDVWDFIGIM